MLQTLSLYDSKHGSLLCMICSKALADAKMHTASMADKAAFHAPALATAAALRASPLHPSSFGKVILGQRSRRIRSSARPVWLLLGWQLRQ